MILTRPTLLHALELALVQSSLTNEEIEARLLCAASDSAVLEKKLATLRSGTRRVDPLEKAKVDKSLDLYSKEWKKRRAQVHGPAMHGAAPLCGGCSSCDRCSSCDGC